MRCFTALRNNQKMICAGMFFNFLADISVFMKNYEMVCKHSLPALLEVEENCELPKSVVVGVYRNLRSMPSMQCWFDFFL